MISLKMGINDVGRRLKCNTCSNLIWLIDFLPSLAGFPVLSSKFNATFWIVHVVLLFYVCILGSVVYQMYFAAGFIDSINSFFNISVFILIFNNSCWLLFKRNELNKILLLVSKNDDLVKKSGTFLNYHEKSLKNIKIIILMCYVFHFVNDVMIYIPTRISGMNEFSTVSCFGLEHLNESPNREICMVILTVQELTAIVAVCSYDVTLLFLFSHTTTMFQILYKDLKSLNDISDAEATESNIVGYRLKNLVIRHYLVIHTVKSLQNIYSTAIGIGFGLDAISLCLFFVLPLDVCLNFAPLIYHSIFVFFLYCFQGQRLTTASEKFEMAVYCCGWQKFNRTERKSILLLLRQAQKPVIILAAGVIPIRIHTFANTMQSIYKFVTVFKL